TAAKNQGLFVQSQLVHDRFKKADPARARFDHFDFIITQYGNDDSREACAGSEVEPDFIRITFWRMKHQLRAIDDMTIPDMIGSGFGDQILMLHLFFQKGQEIFKPLPCFTWNVKIVTQPILRSALRHERFMPRASLSPGAGHGLESRQALLA